MASACGAMSRVHPQVSRDRGPGRIGRDCGGHRARLRLASKASFHSLRITRRRSIVNVEVGMLTRFTKRRATTFSISEKIVRDFFGQVCRCLRSDQLLFGKDQPLGASPRFSNKPDASAFRLIVSGQITVRDLRRCNTDAACRAETTHVSRSRPMRRIPR